MIKKNKKKKQKNFFEKYKVAILAIVLSVTLSTLSTLAATTYLVNSKEVKYDNSTSGLRSDNVQDAIVELNNDATNYEAIMDRLDHINVFPVGSIYISVTNTNPSTYFGGTWVSFGTGRTLVGINTSDGDFNTVEKTGGAKTVTLATANLPSHTHSIPELSGTAASAGAHSHSISSSLEILSTGVGVWTNRAAAGNWEVFAYLSHSTGTAGAHTHTVTTNASTTGATGSGTAVSIMDPYITVYMWKRTA